MNRERSVREKEAFLQKRLQEREAEKKASAKQKPAAPSRPKSSPESSTRQNTRRHTSEVPRANGQRRETRGIQQPQRQTRENIYQAPQRRTEATRAITQAVPYERKRSRLPDVATIFKNPKLRKTRNAVAAGVLAVTGVLAAFSGRDEKNGQVHVAGIVLPIPEQNGASKAKTENGAYRMEADGPHGCPMVPENGNERVVLSQGYGVGSHAPAAIWGGIDLVVDRDGDGVGDPAATDKAKLVATQEGTVHLARNTWPGGNMIKIEGDRWTMRYFHVREFAKGLKDGDKVEPGQVVGYPGMTGNANGIHTHLDLWKGVEFVGPNTDPTDLIECD